MKKKQSKDFEAVLKLIKTGYPSDVTSAITLAKKMGIDILEEIRPLFPMNGYLREWSRDNPNLEKGLSNILLKDNIFLTLSPENNNIDGLVFFQNLNKLIIDTNGQKIRFDFQGLHLKKLIIKNAKVWPLTEAATNGLNAQGLEQLTIFEECTNKTPFTFEVPKNLGNLKSLELLWIEHPNLTTLPQELLALEKLISLTLHTGKPNINIPKTLLQLPELGYTSLNKPPLNNLLNIRAGLEFEVKGLSPQNHWRLALAQRTNPKAIENPFGSPFRLIIAAAQFTNSIFYRKNPTTSLDYFITVFLLFLSSIILSPITLVIYTIKLFLTLVLSFFTLPELVLPKVEGSKSYTLRAIASLAKSAKETPQRDDGLPGIGNVGCIGGAFLLASFMVPTTSDLIRILFIPLMLIILLLGLILEPLWRLLLLFQK
ncbi:MAG: hypothetical protein GY810_17040 [Aureispira sp.]|nr:hypothetical protein [Aureispira sp.]